MVCADSYKYILLLLKIVINLLPSLQGIFIAYESAFLIDKTKECIQPFFIFKEMRVTEILVRLALEASYEAIEGLEFLVQVR